MALINKPRPCGCKGCRTCLVCENNYGINRTKHKLPKENGTYVYCPFCKKTWPGWELSTYRQHPNHDGDPLEYSGVFIDLEFLTVQEEQLLMAGIDSMQWDLSQSGRRKQNFGPKCNFKKKKLQLADFNGFPLFSEFVQDKFKSIPILKGFQTVEQCSLEYAAETGASIDPHIDDCWIWGERIVTVNLLADSVLTMTYNDKYNRYNLSCVEEYPAVLNEEGHNNSLGQCYHVKKMNDEQFPVVRIPMPRRSLLVLYGSARYDWEHQVLREDITDRRVCLAYREFTPPYLHGGAHFHEGEPILEKALVFC